MSKEIKCFYSKKGIEGEDITEKQSFKLHEQNKSNENLTMKKQKYFSLNGLCAVAIDVRKENVFFRPSIIVISWIQRQKMEEREEKFCETERNSLRIITNTKEFISLENIGGNT